MMRRLTIVLLFLALCSLRLSAQGSCRISNTQAVFFQNYSSATVHTTGLVQFHCDKGTPYAIGLNAGSTPGATVTTRKLLRSQDGATLGYQLFSDGAYTINWGNTAGTNWVTGTGTGNDQSLTIYAQIPGAQAFFLNQNGINFLDTVTVAITGNFTSDTRTVQVTLQQVSPGCGIGADSLDFGNYAGAVLNAMTTIQVACTGGTPYTVGLNAGTAAGASVTNRSMTLNGGRALLGYALYSNAGYSVNWGNSNGSWVAGTGNNAVQSLTVYGQIPARQSVPTGNYTDTIVATLTY